MDLDQSILSSIKQMLGITDSTPAFDEELISHINSTFTILNQLDVGSDDGYMISGYRETWREFCNDIRLSSMVREFIYLKVKMIFDPPASSVVADAFNQRTAEIEWRINVQAERLAALANSESEPEPDDEPDDDEEGAEG